MNPCFICVSSVATNHLHYCLALLAIVSCVFGLQWAARKPSRDVRRDLLKFLKRQR
jgi:hypothetical protein